MNKIIYVLISFMLTHSYIYSQTARDYLLKAKELEKKADSLKVNTTIKYWDILETEQNKKRFETLSEAYTYYELSIKTDSSYYCAYWDAYNFLVSNEDFSNENKELRLLNKIGDALIISGHEIDSCFSAREVFVDIATIYHSKYFDAEWKTGEDRYTADDIDTLKLAINNYQLALNFKDFSKEKYEGFSMMGYSNQDICDMILFGYNDIIDFYKEKKYFYQAIKYIDKAILYTNKCPDPDYTAEEYIIQKNVINTLRIENNWFPFFSRNLSTELISNNSYLYLYNEDEMDIKNNIIKLWIMTKYVGDLTKFDSSKYYEGKLLTEFDLTQKKSKIILEIYYDINSNVLYNITYDNPEWNYIIPDTIFETIFIYLKQKTKK